VEGVPLGLDLAKLAEHQQSCLLTQRCLKSTALQIRPVSMEGVQILCDLSTCAPRPVIPPQDRQAVFQAFHCLAHSGTRATRRPLAARVVWRGLNSDVTAWV